MLALGASTLPFGLAAQSRARKAPHRIAFVSGFAPGFRDFFVARMLELGWHEGRDYVTVVPGAVLPDSSLLREYVAAALKQDPDILVVSSTAGAVEAHRQTKSLPIVMLGSGYPVEAGVAESLARPGKNVTGNTIYAGTGIWGKLLELLRESKPGIKRVGILWGYVPPAFPRSEVEPCYAEFRQAAGSLGLALRIVEVPARDRIAAAVHEIASDRPDALFMSGWLTLGDDWPKVIELARTRQMPIISDFVVTDESKRTGPLLIYAPARNPLWLQAISYIDRIMKGAKPGDLPIQLPARFELTVSLRTAKAIGLQMPQSILLRADRVIE